MKIHPVHMMMVHFPAALFPADLVFGLIATFISDEGLALAGYYCLLAGVITGWVAMITGFVDLFLYVLKSANASTGWTHAIIQSTMLCVFTVLFVGEYKNKELVTEPPLWLFILKLLLLILLLAGNYFGGELVLRTVAKHFRRSNG